MFDESNDRRLAELLTMIEANDGAYGLRYGLVLEAVWRAHELGYQAGVRVDPQNPEWPVVYIELLMPDGSFGQVSWHIPQHPVPWDGHRTPEKYARCRAFAQPLAVED